MLEVLTWEGKRSNMFGIFWFATWEAASKVKKGFSECREPKVARVWFPNSDLPGLAMARAFGDLCLKFFGLTSILIVYQLSSYYSKGSICHSCQWWCLILGFTAQVVLVDLTKHCLHPSNSEKALFEEPIY